MLAKANKPEKQAPAAYTPPPACFCNSLCNLGNNTTLNTYLRGLHVAGGPRNLECVAHERNLAVELQRCGGVLRHAELHKGKAAGQRHLCRQQEQAQQVMSRASPRTGCLQ